MRSLSYAASHGTVPRPPDTEIAPMLSRELVAAYKMYAILAGLAKDDGIPDWKIDPPYDQLGTEIENEIGTVRERVLNLLALTGQAQARVRRPGQASRKRSAEVDAKIAELVDATLDRDLAASVVPLFEHLSLANGAAGRAPVRRRSLPGGTRSARGHRGAGRPGDRRARDAGSATRTASATGSRVSGRSRLV